MKVLWLVPQSIHTEPMVSTLPGVVYDYLKGRGNKILSPLECCLGILETIRETKPKVIVFLGIAEGPYFIPPHVFSSIDIPIIHFCCDASCPGWEPGIKAYCDAKCFDVTVNIDGNDNWLKHEKDLTLWCPLDPSFYKPLPKTRHFGWAGGIGPERQRLLAGLMDIIDILPRNETYGSYKQYADFLSSCKITLNMAKSGSGKSLQTKNRVREAGYANCLLLEERGAPTSNWFTVGEDYLEYGDASEVREIVMSISDARIENMATNLREKTLNLYHPDFFWKKVLSRL